MSRTAQRRRSIRWARYTNHYGFMSDVSVGGWSFVYALNVPGRHWMFVRRQAKRKWSGQ